MSEELYARRRRRRRLGIIGAILSRLTGGKAAEAIGVGEGIKLSAEETRALSELTGLSEEEVRGYAERYPYEPLFVFPCFRCLVAIRPIVKLRACLACAKRGKPGGGGSRGGAAIF